MAWTTPTAITSSTKISDTDNIIEANAQDLEAYVNGVAPYVGVGLTANMVDKTTAQTITAQKTFSSAIVASGGVTGDLTGDVTGDTAGTHTGDVVGNISVIPNGIIVMWGGSVASIPAEWNLCDGTNGTVDLRNRFIVCAGGTYTELTTGGSDSTTLTEAQLPSHTHSVTVNSKALSTTDHTHSFSFPRNTGLESSGVTGANGAFSSSAYSSTTGSGGAEDLSHDHTASAGNTGSGSSIDNRPAYYALAYIQKV